jgi:hypothetical protein
MEKSLIGIILEMMVSPVVKSQRNDKLLRTHFSGPGRVNLTETMFFICGKADVFLLVLDAPSHSAKIISKISENIESTRFSLVAPSQHSSGKVP